MKWAYSAKVNKKSWLGGDSNSHLRVTGELLYQLSYRVNREQYAPLIQLKCTSNSRNNITFDIREDVQCFDSISESSSW